MGRAVDDLDLQVLDKELNLLGSVTQLSSLILPKNLSGFGTFNLKVPITDNNKELLKEDRIIWDGGDFTAEIENIDSELQENGISVMVLKGRTLEKLLLERVVFGTYSATKERPNDSVKNLVIQNCISPVDEKRKMPLLEIGNCELENPLEESAYQKTGGLVYNAVKDKLESYGLGFEIKVDVENKKYLFSIIEGKDRTQNNTLGNEPVIFSSDLEDILKSNYHMNKIEYANVAIVSGEALESGVTRKVISGDADASGYDRKEIWVDARDIQSESTADDGTVVVLTEEQVIDALNTRGNEKLSEHKKSETYSATVRTFGTTNFVYKVDYDIGDRITIVDEDLGVEIDAQITGIEETFEEDYDFTIKFGYETMKMLEKVNKTRSS